MDEPQPMFRTDLKPLRNKDGQCDKCYKYPEEGQPRFAACAACKMALYCSKECQRGDWEKHREDCETGKRTRALAVSARHDSADARLYKDRIMMSDYWTCHYPLCSIMIRIMCDRRGHPVDPVREGIKVELVRRLGKDGNPALRYKMQDISILQRREIEDFGELHGGPPIKEALRKMFERQIAMRDADPDCAHNPNVLVIDASMASFYRIPIFQPPHSMMPSTVEEQDQWLAQARKDIELGIVMKKPDGDIYGPIPPRGILIRKGRRWEWMKLPDDEKNIEGLTRLVDAHRVE